MVFAEAAGEPIKPAATTLVAILWNILAIALASSEFQ
jgi:hypothetical protein